MANEWAAFLPMRIPTVTHNDLAPLRAKGGRIGIRKSDALKDAEDALMARIRAAGVPEKPVSCAARLTVTWCFLADGRHTVGEPHTSKPDMSNMLKTLEDCLTRCSVISDDSIICQEFLAKGYAEHEGIYIEVTAIDADVMGGA